MTYFLKLFSYKQGFLYSLQNLINFKKKFNFYFLLIYPNIKCSTKSIYSKINNFTQVSKYNFRTIKSNKNFINFLKTQSNDLQSIVVKKHSNIQKILKYRVTYLEMDNRPKFDWPKNLKHNLNILLAESFPSWYFLFFMKM